MKRSFIAILIMSLLALVTTPAFAIARPGAPVGDQVAQPIPVTQTNNTQQNRKAGAAEDIRRYQAREQASPNAKNYKGGDVIVISASAVAIVLAIILLIILI